MRESNENGRFLASRPATSLTDPTSSQRPKPPLRNPHARFFQGRRSTSAIGRIAMPPVTTGAEITHSLRKKVVAIPLAVTPIGSAVAKLVVAEQGGLALGAPLSSTGQGGRCIDRSTAWRLHSARRSGPSEVHFGILQNRNRPVRAPRRDHDRNDQIVDPQRQCRKDN